MQKDFRNALLTATAALALSLPAASAQEAADIDVTAEIIALPEWHPELLQEGGFSAEEFIDEMEVYGSTGDEIGEVENIIVGADGKVLSIIAEVGGLWDIGDTHVNVPWDQLKFTAEGDGVIIPVTQETVEDYSLFNDDLLTAGEAATDVTAVEGDGPGVVSTGARAWRVTELIDDYTRLKYGDGFANYGYVDDVIIKDGQVASVVVRPDVSWGARGLYAYPYYGYRYGWNPGLGYYDLPYARDDVAEMEPIDYEKFRGTDMAENASGATAATEAGTAAAAQSGSTEAGTATDETSTASADQESRDRALKNAEGAGMTNVRVMDRVFVLQGMTPQGETVFMLVNPPGALIGIGSPVGSGAAGSDAAASSADGTPTTTQQ